MEPTTPETGLAPPPISGETLPGERRLLVVVALAVAAAISGALVAPGDWAPGQGRTTLEYRGVEVIDAPVLIGESGPIVLDGSADSVLVEMTFPEGIPVESPVEALIEVTEGGTTIEPAVGDVNLTLTLPDGREEAVPIAQWDEEDRSLEALRRPTRSAAVVLGLLGFVVVMWVSEVVPLFVTSMLIPVVLVVSGVAPAVDATAPFFNPIIVLFFAGFLMAEAMTRSGLDGWISVNITARVGKSAVFLFAGMLGLAAFMSMWMSNTAATAVLVPIALAITAPLRHEGFRRALVLGIAYAASIGGVGSAIGTPANQLAVQFLDEFGGRSVSFVDWFGFGLPMVILFLPLMGGYLWWRSKVRMDPDRFSEVRRLAVVEMTRLGRPGRDQLVVLTVFGVVAAGWLTEVWHGVAPGIVALCGAIVLFVLRRLEPEDLGRISWPSLLTFGGGLTLGLFLVSSGASDYVATRMAGLAALPGIVAVLVVATITLLLTTVASNTASAAIIIPMAIPLAAVVGVTPTILVVVVAIASSVDFALVIGTPPTMIAYSTRLYTAGEILRKGAVLDVVGILLLVLVVTRMWELLGLA